MQFEFEAIGTHWEINIFSKISESKNSEILEKITNRIESFDKSYSRFRKDSLVSEIARNPGVYLMPEDAEILIPLYYRLYKMTEGFITPLIGQMLVDAGYDPEYSLKQKKTLVEPPEWDEVLSYVHPYLTVKKPVLLDFGAIGKGLLIDIVGEILKKEGVSSFCIDAGGDILVRNSEKQLRIGLENPENFNEAIGVVELSNKSLCGSAGSRRKWEGFHHIMNPKTLESQKNILSTWVVADTACIADALASCLFFVTSDILEVQYDFEYIVLYADYSIRKSNTFPGEIFIK